MAFERYLGDYVNKMHDLLAQERAGIHPKQAIREAATLGCIALQRLMEDRNFYRTIEGWARIYPDMIQEALYETTRNVEVFEEFLSIEYQVLVKGGLFPDIAANLIHESRQALKQVRQGAKPINEIIESAQKLKEQACQTSALLVDQNKKDAGWKNFKDKVKNIATGTGAIVLVGLNGAAVAPSAAIPFMLPISVGVATASITFGGVVLGNVIKFPKKNDDEN